MRPLKGKRLTTFCASLALLHPLLSLTHWIFRSHSAKCVRCASLRSGGPPIGGQDRDGASYRCSAPYTLSRFAGLPLKGKRGTWREKQASHILHVPFRCFPLWWLAPPPFRPAGKRVTGFSVAYGSLRIQFPCHRKRGHYKVPRSHVLISCSTLSTGCSATACGGSPAQPERGASAASQSAECFSCHMTLKS